ncbi:MAG: hypothetical protein WC307_04895 [Candidatus Nanoarchaeia archaeon]|jgi:hypothetical protein
MRKVLLILPLLLMSAVMADSVCKYTPGQTIFRCSDVLPTTVITPGTTGNLTIYCCLTGDAYNTTDEYNIIFNIINNDTSRDRVTLSNGSIGYQTSITYYTASNWVTSVDYPETATGFEAFPVTVYFSVPVYEIGFLPGTIFKARFDVRLNTGGTLGLNIGVLPNIIIPGDYNPLTYPLMVGLPVAGIIGVGVYIMLKKKKHHRKMKKASK